MDVRRKKEGIYVRSMGGYNVQRAGMKETLMWGGEMHELTKRQKERIGRTSFEVSKSCWEVFDQETREWIKDAVAKYEYREDEGCNLPLRQLLGIEEKTLEEKFREVREIKIQVDENTVFYFTILINRNELGNLKLLKESKL